MLASALLEQTIATGPAHPTNLTVWGLRPRNLSSSVANKNTADQAGDIFFYITDRMVAPYACRVNPTEWFCKEQGALAHDSVYTQTVLEVDGSWPNASAHGRCSSDPGRGCYAACNPVDASGAIFACKCGEAGPPCDLNGKANILDKYPDCADGCHAPNDLWKSDLSKVLGGFWFSTTDEADCDNATSAACAWRALETVKTINATCANSKIHAAIEAHDAAHGRCFDTCSAADRLNITSTCWTICAAKALLGASRSFPNSTQPGMTRAALVDPWTRAFSSDDPNDGGCPPLPRRAAPSPPRNASCAVATVPLISYHIHVLFPRTDEEKVAAALRFQHDFMEAFDLLGKPNCSMTAGDPSPQTAAMCAFEIDWDAAGPFLTAQYSFFVPSPILTAAQAWAVRHRGILDVLVHPNSGCEVEDHTKWALWGGSKWELDTSIFSCEYPGCVPKDS
jgi:aromatic ring-cleaving dioxygenase